MVIGILWFLEGSADMLKSKREMQDDTVLGLMSISFQLIQNKFKFSGILKIYSIR